MNMIDDFAIKQRKYMPVFPKATGTPTQYIPGYPDEDEHPISVNEIHGVQMHTFFDQAQRSWNASVQNSRDGNGVENTCDLC